MGTVHHFNITSDIVARGIKLRREGERLPGFPAALGITVERTKRSATPQWEEALLSEEEKPEKTS